MGLLPEHEARVFSKMNETLAERNEPTCDDTDTEIYHLEMYSVMYYGFTDTLAAFTHITVLG